MTSTLDLCDHFERKPRFEAAKKRLYGEPSASWTSSLHLPTGIVRRGFEPDRPCPGRGASVRAQMRDGLVALTSRELEVLPSPNGLPLEALNK